jgi:hypothetical protein
LGEPSPYLYRSAFQVYRPEITILVRAAGDPRALTERLTRTIHMLESRLPVFNVWTLREHIGFALWWTELAVALASSLGGLALFLAALGLHSVLAYSVSQRTREMGIRLALGARPADLTRMFVRRGMSIALLGIAAGLAASLFLAGPLTRILFGVREADPAALTGVILILLGASFMASYLPARRAACTDPMAALRQQ